MFLKIRLQPRSTRTYTRVPYTTLFRSKLMGLGYPGGPALSRLAQQGDSAAFDLPRPMLHSPDLDFSFSGLKTAVLTRLKTLEKQPGEIGRAHVCTPVTNAQLVCRLLLVKITYYYPLVFYTHSNYY